VIDGEVVLLVDPLEAGNSLFEIHIVGVPAICFLVVVFEEELVLQRTLKGFDDEVRYLDHLVLSR